MQPLLSPLTTSSSDSCCPEFPIPAWAVDLTFALQFTSFFILTTASETESRNTCRGRREGERERGREAEREVEIVRIEEEWRGREVGREEGEEGGGGGERDLLNQSKCTTIYGTSPTVSLYCPSSTCTVYTFSRCHRTPGPPWHG